MKRVESGAHCDHTVAVSGLDKYHGANDNAPAWALERPTRRKPSTRTFPFTRQKQKSARTATSSFAWVSLLSVLLILAAGFSFFALLPWQQTRWIGVAGLVALGIAAFTPREKRELPILAACTALTAVLPVFASVSELTLGLTDLALVVTLLTGAIAWLYASRTGLMFSLMASAVWLFSLLPMAQSALGLDAISQQSWWPVAGMALGLQYIAARRLRQGLALGLVAALAYGCCIILLTQNGFSAMAISGLIFAIGAAQALYGKARGTTQPVTAGVNRSIGILAAITATLFLQTIWLDPAMNEISAIPAPKMIWWSAFALAAGGTFIASMIRYKANQSTLLGAFLLSAILAILPLSSQYPDAVRTLLSGIAGFSPAPGFGIMIGAAVLATSLFWVVKSLMRGRTLALFGSSLLFAIEILILGRYDIGIESLDLGALDFTVLFGASLIAALAIGGLVSGGLERDTPQQS